MTKRDKRALELAVSRCLADPVSTEQIRAMLAEEAWEKVAMFCSSCCQTSSLGLRPWERAPCRVDADNPDEGLHRPYQEALDGRYEAAELLRKMLALGISRWDPDPLRAIAAARKVDAS